MSKFGLTVIYVTLFIGLLIMLALNYALYIQANVDVSYYLKELLTLYFLYTPPVTALGAALFLVTKCTKNQSDSILFNAHKLNRNYSLFKRFACIAGLLISYLSMTLILLAGLMFSCVFYFSLGEGYMFIGVLYQFCLMYLMPLHLIGLALCFFGK